MKHEASSELLFAWGTLGFIAGRCPRSAVHLQSVLSSPDVGGKLISWTLPDDGFKQTPSLEIKVSWKISPDQFCKNVEI